MKTTYILIALIIIAGGLYYFSSQETSTPNESEALPAADEQSMPAMEDGGTDNTATEEETGTSMEAGTDAGMEFPTAEDDLEVDADANMVLGAETHVIDVSGKNFAFDVTEIRVKEGDTVTINFTSTDGFHDWVVDEFDAATDRIQTGGNTSVTFVADQKGSFEYYCSVGQHRANGMVGTLIVE